MKTLRTQMIQDLQIAGLRLASLYYDLVHGLLCMSSTSRWRGPHAGVATAAGRWS